MEATTMTALISGLCVAIPNVIATIVSSKKNYIKEELKEIKQSLKNETLSRCKVDLINAMSKIQNGYVPTEEERRILIEEKEQYNSLGGDSYVDDMFDELKTKHLL